MNILALTFLFVNSIALFLLPRRWAPLPFLLGACYMTLAQGVELGPFTFTVIRIIMAIGFARVIIRGEHLGGSVNAIDWLMVMLGIWTLLSSLFQTDIISALIFRMGLVYNVCGFYFICRIFIQSIDDIVFLFFIVSIILIPLAIEMAFEKIQGINLFNIFGGVPYHTVIRDGTLRAQGPFSHPILAGSVGAVCLPFMVGLWLHNRLNGAIGIATCLTMVFTSGSSGPILSSLAGAFALLMWHFRSWMRFFRWFAVIGYIGLDMIMKAPAYYVLERIAMVGGSTGYHRARLIQAAIEHIDEWWLAGTEYTRHWMVTGVSWSPDHVDITNYYLRMGVNGGLPLMIIFILILSKGFSYIGILVEQNTTKNVSRSNFFTWSLGAALFAHAATCLSISYFDQSFIFIYLTLAAVGTIWDAIGKYPATSSKPEDEQIPSSIK